MSYEEKTDGLLEFIKKHTALILFCISSLIPTIYGFYKLLKDKDSEGFFIVSCVTVVFILLGTCVYYAYFWKPESRDANPPLITTSLPESEELIKSQKKKRRERRAVRYFSRIGIIVIPVVSLLGFFCWNYIQSLPPKDITILVADFDGPDPDNYRVAATIRRNLEKETARYPNIKVKSTEIIKEKGGSEKAREEGKKQKATIVVWGWYWKTKDIMPISVHFELLIGLGFHISLAIHCLCPVI